MVDYDEQVIIEALKDEDSGSHSMRVTGRGTLTMSAKAARESKKYKALADKSDRFISKLRSEWDISLPLPADEGGELPCDPAYIDYLRYRLAINETW